MMLLEIMLVIGKEKSRNMNLVCILDEVAVASILNRQAHPCSDRWWPSFLQRRHLRMYCRHTPSRVPCFWYSAFPPYSPVNQTQLVVPPEASATVENISSIKGCFGVRSAGNNRGLWLLVLGWACLISVSFGVGSAHQDRLPRPEINRASRALS